MQTPLKAEAEPLNVEHRTGETTGPPDNETKRPKDHGLRDNGTEGGPEHGAGMPRQPSGKDA